MNDTPTLPSDRQLVAAARAGHDAAWHELMERHRPSVLAGLGRRRGFARHLKSDRLDALRTELLAQDTAGEGDEAIRAFRPRMLAAITRGAYGPADSNSQAPTAHETGARDRLLARAFGRLPEPWQTVLWHSYVECLTSAEVSPLVGRSTSDVSDLIATAERGLVDAYAIEYLADVDVDDETAAVVPLLGGYVRDALPPFEQRRVEQHLAADGARRAREIIDVASTVPDTLPPAIAPGITGLSVEEYRNRLGTTDRAVGAATFCANRSDRTRRAVVIGSVAAVAVALIGVAAIARPPFGSHGNTTGPSSSHGDAGTTIPDPSPTTAPPASDADPVEDPEGLETTELELRPTVTGPSNTIEVVVEDGSRALGLVRVGTPLRTEVSTPAPVFAGGTGTLDLVITNPGSEAAEATVELRLPSGVVFDGLVAGDAECVDPADGSPFCNVSVAADAAFELSVRIALQSSVVGHLRIEGDTFDEALEVPISVTPDLVHNSVGRGEAILIGNTVMTCDDEVAAADGISCADVRNGTGEIVNRWDVPMGFVGAAPAFGLFNGSSAILDVPADARIVHAQLFWSGDLEQRGVRAVDGAQSNVSLTDPGGAVVGVEAEHIYYGEDDSTQYVGRADVTDLVAAAGAGNYLIGNVASVEATGAYGGWGLVVVFDHDDAPRRHRIVVDPFDWVAPQDPFSYEVDMPAPVVSGGAGHLGVLAFEGERGFGSEQFVVGGERLGGDNPFDSTIVGERDPAFDNNLGVDVDAYDLTIDTPDGILDFRATSDDDGIRLAVVVLTVDLAP